MILRVLVGSLFALSAINASAGNLYIYKDKNGNVLKTIVNPSSNSNKFTNPKKIKTTQSGQRIGTSEVVARPSVRKTIATTDKASSKDTYIKTKNNIHTSLSTDNIAKYYKPVPWSKSEMKNFDYRKGLEKVDVMRINDVKESHDSMVSNGYLLLGVSRFFDRRLLDSAFLSQAEKIGAQSVAVYEVGSSNVTYSSTDSYGNEVDVDPNSLPHVYDYSAYFYVKDNSSKRPNMLGITISEIPLDKRNKYQRNTGAYLMNVVKGTRAYIANIIPEDVIIAINGKSIIMADDFKETLDSELKISKNLTFTIIRLVNDEPKEIKISVNFV